MSVRLGRQRHMKRYWLGVDEKAAGGIILRPPGSKYINAEKSASPVRNNSQGTIDSGIEKWLFHEGTPAPLHCRQTKKPPLGWLSDGSPSPKPRTKYPHAARPKVVEDALARLIDRNQEAFVRPPPRRCIMIGEAMMGASALKTAFDMAKAQKDIDDRTPGTTGRSWGAIVHDLLRLTADCISTQRHRVGYGHEAAYHSRTHDCISWTCSDAASRRCANKRGAK